MSSLPMEMYCVYVAIVVSSLYEHWLVLRIIEMQLIETIKSFFMGTSAIEMVLKDIIRLSCCAWTMSFVNKDIN